MKLQLLGYMKYVICLLIASIANAISWILLILGTILLVCNYIFNIIIVDYICGLLSTLLRLITKFEEYVTPQ